MKTLLQVSLFLFSTTIHSQVTITEPDIANIFAVGKSWLQMGSDEPQASMNVGAPSGSSQNWIVPSINWEDTVTLINIAPGSTLYQSYFPAATHAQYASGEVMGFPATLYAYFSLTSAALTALGNVIRIQSTTIDTFFVEINEEIVFDLPIGYGYFILVARDSTDLGGGMWSIFTRTRTSDAFGNITMPFGSYASLRITETDETKIYSGGTVINEFGTTNFTWIAPDGGVFQGDIDSSSVTTGTLPLYRTSLIQWVPTTNIDADTDLSHPSDFELYQNYPNPFNPSTIISYSLPFESDVKLYIHNVLGEKIAELVSAKQSAGTYGVTWDAAGYATGIYFYTLETKSIDNAASQKEYRKIKKMILIK